jgi:hypothetical protein
MPAHLYRDAHVGIRARLGELESKIAEREARLTDAFWASLDPYVQERMSELRRGMALMRSTSFEELARAEVLLSAYVDELDVWIGRAPALEEAWLERPPHVDDPPPVPESGPRLSTESGREFVRSFVSMVKETTQHAEIVAEGWWSCVARFRHRDAPFVLRGSALATDRGQIGEVAMQLVTSVARATPQLLVKHESLFAAVRKVLCPERDVEVGDASFDGLFLIRGASGDVRRFLVPSVRSSLLALARFDVPTLEIDPRKQIASLSWFFEPAVSAVHAALRTLVAIRETPATICFRR